MTETLLSHNSNNKEIHHRKKLYIFLYFGFNRSVGLEKNRSI